VLLNSWRLLDKNLLHILRGEINLAGGTRGNEVHNVEALLLLLFTDRLLLEDTLVVIGHDTDEEGKEVVEVVEDPVSNLRTSVVTVIFNEAAKGGNLARIGDLAKLNHLLVDLAGECVGGIENVGDTSTHTSSEVATCDAENHNATTSHVLAAMITTSLNDGVRTRVTNCETLGGDTTDEGLSRSSTIQADVSDDDVLFGLERGLLGRVYDEATTREALPDVVIGVTLELNGDTRSKECTKRLASGTLHRDVDGVLGKTLFAVELGDAVGERRSKGTIGVGDLAIDVNGETFRESGLGLVDELVVKADVELVVLLTNAVGGSTRTHLPSGLEDSGQVEVGRLGGAELLVDLEHVGTTNHFVDGAETELRHVRAEFLSDVVEEVDDLLRLTSKLGTELRILGGDTDRAGVNYERCQTVKRQEYECNVRWHFLIMMHPIAISGVVAKPHSSAPSKQAIATSRPVRI